MCCGSILGKNEEQLPQPTVGRLLTNSRPTVGQQSANCWSTASRQLADSRPTVGQLSANCRPTVGRLSFTAFYENLLPTVGRLSADCWQHVGNFLAKCRPTVGRQSADWLRALVKYQKSLSSQGRTLHIDAK